MEEARELSSHLADGDPLSGAAAAPPEEALEGGASVAVGIDFKSHRERSQLFERQLSAASASTSSEPETPIDMANLRALASAGLPERSRAVAWKLLLGYLPRRRGEWARTLEEKRGRYSEFCSSFVVEAPGGEGGGGAGEPTPAPETGDGDGDGEENDHPLSQAPTSRWGSYFRDADLVAQIARDVARTHPGLHFFRGRSSERRRKKAAPSRRGTTAGRAPPPPSSRRSEMARALLVFAKLNPGLAYVQGMNEVLAPLYYHCALEEEEEEEEEEEGEEEEEEETTAAAATAAAAAAADDDLSSSFPAPPALHPPSRAEADAFWCLVALMADFRDNFCAALDRSAEGVAGSLARFERAFRAADPELAAHVLDRNSVSPHFFAFRWCSLLLTQEFELPDVARLWDYLLAASGGEETEEGGGPPPTATTPPPTTLPMTRPEALARLCVAMLVRARGPLLRGDFAANLKLLQRYPPDLADVRELLAVAGSLPARVGRGDGEEGGAAAEGGSRLAAGPPAFG